MEKDINSKSNRLIQEKSPYLLEHAHNPVDWYPWGEEAFLKAKAEDKPIFLSIGYSACHWCHVMAKESFENDSVAEVLNKWFVCIKVDREERPDIDHVYMSFCQTMTGQGGWPMSIFMTGEQKPFFAATYIPRGTNDGQGGIISLATQIHEIWGNERGKLLASSEEVVRVVREHLGAPSSEELEKDVLQDGYERVIANYDSEYGGFGRKPKFPTPHHLLFLLHWWNEKKDPSALEVVEGTLKGMYNGGIFDHVGFGFSRYSVDERWLTPHFEKMLYDNALLAKVYTEAYLATGRVFYQEIAKKVITYVLRDMRSPEGGFYSAEDADSEGVEGKFYTWTQKEVLAVLGEKEGNWFSGIYGITANGNFEGKNILNLIGNDFEAILTEAMEVRLEEARRRLFEVREKRIHPHKDDKVLTSWNGLMIGALAYAGRVFEDREYIDAAKAAVRFIEERMMDGNGRLLASYREGEARLSGFLDSYAYFVSGLIELHQATMEDEYLEMAINYTEIMTDLFLDDAAGDFFLKSRESEGLVIEAKDIYDSALPSGNSVAAMNLMRLFSLTENQKYYDLARRLFIANGKRVREQPVGFTYLLCAFLIFSEGTSEVVLAGNREDEQTREMMEAIRACYLPGTTVLIQDPERKGEKGKISGTWREPLGGKTTAYICRNFSCEEGITDVEALRRSLRDD